MVLTALLGFQAAQTSPRFYASEVVVIQPPVSTYAPNPMTGLYPSMAITAAAIATRLKTPESIAEFRKAGIVGPIDFQPRNTGTNQQPRYVIASLTVTNVAPLESSGLRALAILTAAFERELEELQDRWRVATHLRMTVAMLVPPSATLLPHSAKRALFGSALLGGLSTMAVTLWFEQFARRRRDGGTAPAGNVSTAVA